MPPSLINRYLFRELTIPTILCLLVFTFVMIAGRMVRLADLVINKGVAVVDILTLFLTLLPSFLFISLPLAFLMGIMLGMGRLSADNETIALKTAGIGLEGLARPTFALALICALLTAAISWWVAPWGNRVFKSTLYDITRNKASVGLQPQTFIKQFNNLVLYVDRVDSRTGEMGGVFIVEQQERGALTILAESGRLQSDPAQQTVTLSLYNGHLHRESDDKGRGGYQVIGFSRYDIRPELAPALTGKEPTEQKPKDMGLAELWQHAGGSDRQEKLIRTELHRRLCTPLAPLLFALLALPFSTHLNRSGRSSGFTMGLAIYLGYHFLMSFAETMTAEAGLHPFYSLWLIQLLLLVTGLYLLNRARLERPLPLLDWLDNAITRSTRLIKRYVHS